MSPESPALANRSTSFWLIAVAAVIVAQIVSLYLMGRVPICECGYVKLFEPGVNTPGNSQHLSDWYTPSHIIHGFLFYLLGFVVLRRQSLGAKLLLGTVLEVAWELLENSPVIIDRYRSATMAVGYSGDSILNSAMDTVFMVAGFWFAARMPVKVTVIVAIALELLAAYVIRDNLTLNVVMLVWPIEAIKVWQAAL
ncbi:MAG: DUF2585 domain-containing protein [Allorhizobium sp.]